MATARRWYFYGVAFVSQLMLYGGVVGLLRESIGVSRVSGNRALYIALMLVGLPVYALHWWLAQRAVQRGSDERGATLRKAYFYGMQAVTTFFALDALRNLLSSVLSGSSIPDDPVLQGTLLVASVAFWAYHALLARHDAASQPETGGGATLRRWYQFGLAAAGLWLLSAGVHDFAVQLVALSARFGADRFFRLLTDAVALSLTGLVAWLPIWLRLQKRMLADADEQRSLLRKVYLYGAVFAGAAFALFSLAAWLQAFIRIAFGDPPPVAPSLAEGTTNSLVTALLGAMVWGYNARVLTADARLPTAAPRQASIRRLYDYLVAALSLSALLTGVALLLEMSMRIALNWKPFFNSDVGWWRGQLAWGVAATVVGLPVWLRIWGRIQALAGTPGQTGQAERNATLRKTYLFGTALVSAVVVLINLAAAVYQVLRIVLGESSLSDSPGDIAGGLGRALVVGVAWVYHLRVIRREGTVAATVARSSDGKPSLLQQVDASASAVSEGQLVVIRELSDALVAAGSLATGQLPPISTGQMDTRSERVASDSGCYVENGIVVALAMRGCGLMSLPDSIGELIGLRQLDLTGNRLTALPESLCNLLNLQRLYLDDNQLAALPVSIGNLQSLEELYLDKNQLSTLPASIGKLANLRVLNVYNNPLADLPTELGALTGLTEVSVGHNQLSVVPDSFWQLTNLEVLNLAEARFASIPEAIGGLTKLHTLDLGHNELSGLPNSFARLTAMRDFLYLSNNHLTALPDALAHLTQLRYLNATDNQLTTLPDWIGWLTALRELRLYNNQIASLPDSLGQLTALRELHLMNNRLVLLPASIGFMRGLAHLDLRNNQLRALPESVGDLASLSFLDLRNNKLVALPESLATLPRLAKLDLRWNKLGSRPAWFDALEARGCAVLM